MRLLLGKGKVRTILLVCIMLAACDKRDNQTYQGYVEGDALYLSSPYSGKLINLAVLRGKQVKKGQFLFKLDPNSEKFKLRAKQNELDSADKLLSDQQKPQREPQIKAIESKIAQVDSELSLAKIRVDRDKKLYKKGAADKDKLDSATAAVAKQHFFVNSDLSFLLLRRFKSEAQQCF